MVLKNCYENKDLTLVLIITLTFTGEAGWLFREYLTMTMKYFAKCPDCFFGFKNILLVRSTVRSIEESKYYILSQLTVLIFLYTGRGPQCLNPVIGPAIYGE